MDNREISDMAAQTQIAESVISNMFFIRPGIIKRFYPELNRVDVQVAIKSKKPDFGEGVEYEELPIITGVPIAVQFSQSSGMATTFPIHPGDQCTLLFSDRMIDLYLKKGEISLPESVGTENMTSEPRMHEIEDAMCFPGVIVKSNVIQGWNNDAIEIRDKGRKTFLSITPGTINETAPGGITMTDGNATISIHDGQVNISAPNGVYIDAPNMSVDGSAGRLSGVWSADNFDTTAGFDANSHRHSGVEPGGGNTGRFV